MAQIIKIQTSEGTVSEVNGAILCKFAETIRTMVNFCPDDQGDRETVSQEQDTPIILQHIEKETFDSIMTWATHHHSHPSNLASFDSIPRADRAGHMVDWDKEFIDGLNYTELKRILVAVNFLDIPELMTLCCQKALLDSRGKTLPEIREMLGIPDDLSEELKERIALENQWLAFEPESQ